jgi:hypothetical protein
VDRCRLPLAFPSGALLAELESLPAEAWVDHFVQHNYEGSWRILPLRGPAGETHPIRMATSHPGQGAYEDTWLLARCPAFRKALDMFRCGLRSVRVMALGPGSRIREHRDPDLDGGGGIVRLHVPLATHAGVRFLLNGVEVPFQAGECWFLRLSDPHAVENPGPGPRVHLVIDAELNEWLREMLSLPEPAARMLAFMEEIGLRWELAELGEGTFLPGLCIDDGVLRVDATRLQFPGDILHEAGHLAVTPAAQRATLGPDGLGEPGLEIAALAWSYAACLHLGLAPEVVFHPSGYKGQADWLRETFRQGGNLGQPLLAWMGLTRWGSNPQEPDRFPAMARWLRA